MIQRYVRPEMAALWSEEHKFKVWLEVEIAALEAMAEQPDAPGELAEAAAAMRAFQKTYKPDPARIDEIEAVTRHDVIAFLTSVAEIAGPQASKLHLGMTSSDLLDTALAVRLREAGGMIMAELERVLEALRARAEEHRYTVCIGRSHGVHAEPTTFGLKLLTYVAEFQRHRVRLADAIEGVATCVLSGAVGTYSQLAPSVEAALAARLGLTPEPVSTQVAPRDRHAAFFAALALVASSVERLAVEVRHLQRTEVLEAREAFGQGQKGSSAMPHKRNPVLSENLTGLARLVRSAVIPAMENVALWHERDISHSSVERGICADATAHLHFALHRTAGLVQNLVVDKAKMLSNFNSTGGLWASQTVLLALTQSGLARDDAYVIVQRNAMRAWDEGGDFQALLRADPDRAAAIDDEALAACFALDRHLAHVDTIFARVLNEGA